MSLKLVVAASRGPKFLLVSPIALHLDAGLPRALVASGWQGFRTASEIRKAEKQKPSLLLEGRARRLASSAASVREGSCGVRMDWGRGKGALQGGGGPAGGPGESTHDTPPPGTTDKRPFPQTSSFNSLKHRGRF